MSKKERRRRRFQKRGGALLGSLATYISTIGSCSGGEDLPTIMRAGSDLLNDLLRFADAQFDFVGTAHPFGGLYGSAHNTEGGSSDPLHDHTRAILLRADFDTSRMTLQPSEATPGDAIHDALHVILDNLTTVIASARETEDGPEPVAVYAFLGVGEPTGTLPESPTPKDVFSADFEVSYSDESYFLK